MTHRRAAPVSASRRGSAFAYAPTFVAGTNGVPVDKQGVASGLLNAAQDLGGAVGVTALATVAATATVHAEAENLDGGYRAGLLVAAAVTRLAITAVRRLPGPNAEVPPTAAPEPAAAVASP